MHTIEFDGSEPLGFEIKIEIFECLADSESSFAERKSSCRESAVDVVRFCNVISNDFKSLICL